jgi:signal transduction histidine kinase
MSLLDIFGKKPTSAPQDELSHVTQEMYKKNFELAEINKTLSLLRKIDVVVLSSVTDVGQVAQQIADLTVQETSFTGIIIYLYNKQNKSFVPIALSESTENISFKRTLQPCIHEISVLDQNSPIVQSINQKKKISTANLHDICLKADETKVIQVQGFLKIKCLLTYPIWVRDEYIGAITFARGEEEAMLSEHQKDLIARIVDTTGIALDNTQLFDDLQTTSKQLQEANSQLKELDALKDEFVSLASHELRTPMTVIKSYLWMMMEGKNGTLTDKQRVYIERAYTSTERLINLVNDMLNVSRIESGRFTLDLKQTDMNKLIEDVVNEMKPRADELGITIETHQSEPQPLVIIDPDRIKQVIINLIGNSLKFTPKGGKVTISVEMRANRAVVQVSDTGIGIEKADMPKLFRKFGMVGNNYLTKTNTQGTGLGLYLSKSIVELHHGKMLAVSEGKGKGTTFTFMIESAPTADVKQ